MESLGIVQRNAPLSRTIPKKCGPAGKSRNGNMHSEKYLSQLKKTYDFNMARPSTSLSRTSPSIKMFANNSSSNIKTRTGTRAPLTPNGCLTKLTPTYASSHNLLASAQPTQPTLDRSFKLHSDICERLAPNNKLILKNLNDIVDHQLRLIVTRVN